MSVQAYFLFVFRCFDVREEVLTAPPELEDSPLLGLLFFDFFAYFSSSWSKKPSISFSLASCRALMSCFKVSCPTREGVRKGMVLRYLSQLTSLLHLHFISLCFLTFIPLLSSLPLGFRLLCELGEVRDNFISDPAVDHVSEPRLILCHGQCYLEQCVASRLGRMQFSK